MSLRSPASATANRWTPVLIAVLAIILRLYYGMLTPFSVRSYDSEAHQEYVHWILQHWSIPHAAEGYEFYHPPLYYIIAALWSLLTGGWNGEIIDPRSLQVLGWLLSSITVVLSVCIAKRLFGSTADHRLRALFTALLSFLPGLVLFSSRINNDTLATPLQFAAILCLLRWWGAPEQMKHWHASVMLLGLGALTKMNTIVLLPLPFLCLFFLQHATTKKIRTTAAGILLTGAFLALVPFTRWAANGEVPFDRLIPNIGALGGLELPPTKVTHLTAFHPLKILHIPFNDNFDDASNRMYVWDYLIRSALSGEWYHGPLLVFFAQIQLFLALVLLIPIAWGIKKRFGLALTQDTPIALIIPLFLIGEILYRIHYPFSCSQDFRYVTFIALPMAYYLLRGIESFPPVLRFRSIAVVWAFVASAILFVLGLVTIAG